MRRILLFLLLSGMLVCRGQSKVDLQTLQGKINAATNTRQKIDLYVDHAHLWFLSDRKKSDSLAFLATAMAETTRNHNTMAFALLSDATRFLENNADRQNMAHAVALAQKALNICMESQDANAIAACHSTLAKIHRAASQPDLALKAHNDAISMLADVTDDSIRVYVYAGMARTLRVKSDMLNAFKNLLHGQNAAEGSGRASITRYMNGQMIEFYNDIGQYEKGKDYAFKNLAMDQRAHQDVHRLEDYQAIGGTYAAAKEIELAKLYYAKAEHLADSLKLDQAYLVEINSRVVNLLLNNNRFEEGYHLLKTNPILFDFLKKGGLGYMVDRANGYIQFKLQHYDSSFYYYKKAEPFEIKAAPYEQYYFYDSYAMLFRALKQWDKAIECQQKALQKMNEAGDLEVINDITMTLDSLYLQKGDFKNAYHFERLHQQYADSLKKLSEQKDILALEIDNENKRAERARMKEEEDTDRRHNLQYLGISAAIGVIFIVLILFGAFRVSASLVKATGFFAFIFLFEFIILILDNQIHHLTHGEPWKVWLIKIALIAMLLPFHHWIEEKVIHFLIQNHLLVTKKIPVNEADHAKE